MRRHRHRVAAAAALSLLGGCAVVDPRIAAGPEEGGYCMPERAGPGARDHDRGCPPGFRRLYGGYRNRVGTADHFHHAIALLRDRRREMELRDRELAQLNAWSRIVTLGGLGTAVGATAFQGNGTLVAASVLTGAAGYAFGTAFATPGMRGVLLAGIEALNCTETKAFSARVDPLGTTLPARVRGAAPPAGALQSLAMAARAAAAEVRAAAGSPALASLPPGSDAQQAVRNALAGAEQVEAAANTIRSGNVAGNLIANAVFERTLAIVGEVNRQMMQSTPDLNAILALARGAQGLAVNAVADAKQTNAGGNADLMTGAAQADTASRGIRAGSPAAQAGEATAMAAASLNARPEDSVDPLADALAVLSRKARAAADAGGRLLTALEETRNAAVARIAACSFEHQDGSADIALAPAMLELRGNETTGTVVATGGRGPYRVTGTGAETPMRPATELSTGTIVIQRNRAGANTTATFLVEDFGQRTAKPATLTVKVLP